MSAEWADAVNKYKALRAKERNDLSHALSANPEIVKREIRVISGGSAGSGSKNYTSRKRIHEYDLRNWKWVELKSKDESFNCVVSLNMPEVDPGSGNIHCLFDRIGILISFKTEKQFCQTAIYTNINLPLDATKESEIVKIIIAQFDFLCGQRDSGGETAAST